MQTATPLKIVFLLGDGSTLSDERADEKLNAVEGGEWRVRGRMRGWPDDSFLHFDYSIDPNRKTIDRHFLIGAQLRPADPLQASKYF